MDRIMEIQINILMGNKMDSQIASQMARFMNKK